MKLSDKSIMTSMNFPTLPYDNVTYSFLLEIWFRVQPTLPFCTMSLFWIFFLNSSLVSPLEGPYDVFVDWEFFFYVHGFN